MNTTQVPWTHNPSREEIDAFASEYGIPKPLLRYVMALKQSKNVAPKGQPEQWVSEWRPYITVDGRVRMLHAETKVQSIKTQMETCPPPGWVVFRATIVCDKGEYTGTSGSPLEGGGGAEKTNPIECAETSAIGRAIGFADFGIFPGSGIASYEEVENAQGRRDNPAGGGSAPPPPTRPTGDPSAGAGQPGGRTTTWPCPECQAAGRGGMVKILSQGENAQGPWTLYGCTLSRKDGTGACQLKASFKPEEVGGLEDEPDESDWT
jgi:hypothetical protein